MKRTLQVLSKLRDKYAQNIEIRRAAERIVAGVVGNDRTDAFTDRVLQFVKDRVQYMRDPLAWEYVKTPNIMLEQIRSSGYASGDCDDHVLLMNTILDTLGIRTAFVAVMINGSNTFNHVISSVYISGHWVDLDPCAKAVPQPFFGTRLVVY